MDFVVLGDSPDLEGAAYGGNGPSTRNTIGSRGFVGRLIQCLFLGVFSGVLKIGSAS